ncbi:hypothetical protein SFRURICE_009554 [Spodoptera frugiperda]|nr:hypothetical protein SFRURICE_009554 [Spodoptera frugiperda]
MCTYAFPFGDKRRHDLIAITIYSNSRHTSRLCATEKFSKIQKMPSNTLPDNGIELSGSSICHRGSQLFINFTTE